MKKEPTNPLSLCLFLFALAAISVFSLTSCNSTGVSNEPDMSFGGDGIED